MKNSAERYFRPKKGGVPRASTIPGRKVSQGGYSAFARASRIALLPHWNGQAERPRSGVLSAHSSDDDRRTSDQPHRGVAALEHRRLSQDRLLPGRLDPLIMSLVTPERFAQFPWNILLLVHVVPCVVPLEEGVA